MILIFDLICEGQEDSLSMYEILKRSLVFQTRALKVSISRDWFQPK